MVRDLWFFAVGVGVVVVCYAIAGAYFFGACGIVYAGFILASLCGRAFGRR